VAKQTEQLTDLLVPPYVRRYWTFRYERSSHFLPSSSPAQNPRACFALHFLSSVLHFRFGDAVDRVRDTRPTNWYPWRVPLFAVVLASGLIGLVDILLPLHSR
jgi:hypothetical protein